MQITKLIEQLQKLSDQYNGNIDVVIEYKLRNKVMINSKPRVYAKCIYYKEPKPIPNCRLAESGKIHVVISNRVKLYTGWDAYKRYRLGENKI